MNITIEKIAKLDELSNELEELRFALSEQIKTAQDRYGNNLLKTSRGNIAEKVLWEEVYQAGVNCEGAKSLKEVYPEIFDLQAKVDILVSTINNYTAKEFGFLFSEMSANKLVMLVNSLVEYNLKKRNLIYKLYAYLRRKTGA